MNHFMNEIILRRTKKRIEIYANHEITIYNMFNETCINVSKLYIKLILDIIEKFK